MLSPTSRLASGRCFDASMAACRLATRDLAEALERRGRGRSRWCRCRRCRRAARASRNSRTVLLAEALDVHGAPRRRSARCAPAAGPGTRGWCSGVALALEPHQRCCAAHRARRWGTPTGSGPSGRSASTGPTTSGMTSPALRTITVSPGRTSLARTWSWLCSVASADGRAADEHRLEHGERRGLAGAADRHHDVEQRGGALLGRELVGDGPPRRLRREAELARAAPGRRPSRPRRRSRSRGRGGAPASARQ